MVGITQFGRLFLRARNKTTAGIVLAVITAMIFGLYPPASRAAYADGANIAFVIILSTWIRALTLAGFCVFHKHPIFATKEDKKLAFGGGFIQALSIFGILSALSFLPGSIVIIIVFTHTLMLLFYMAARGELKLDRVTVLTTILALVGLSMVLDLWHVQASTNWIGMGLAFLSAVATMMRLYTFGKQMATKNPAVVGAETFLVAAVLLSFFALGQAPVAPVSAMGWFWAFVSAITLSAGTFGMFYGVSMMGAFKWSLFSKLEPIFTALFGYLFLNETLKTGQYVGMAVVLGSLLAFQLAEQRKKKA